MSEAPERDAPRSKREVPLEARHPMIRTALVVGPVVACLGIVWTVIAPSSASSAAILVGLVTAIGATHRFGRLGTDEGAATSTPAPPSTDGNEGAA